MGNRANQFIIGWAAAIADSASLNRRVATLVAARGASAYSS